MRGSNFHEFSHCKGRISLHKVVAIDYMSKEA